ncbi:DUF3306 domain-containing protein [Oxalobacteraceae bacterium OM1]|nr:DUF3306 domain-containing protein [Oxalobacteraceae bacterium OM1]
MEAESFFSRWSRRKAEAKPEPAKPEAEVLAPAPDAPPPTVEDAEKLTKDSDFTPFMARNVDESVKRTALKKLFSDPHFNVMDGLDIYIDDYTKPDPIPPEMLAALVHAKDILNPPGQAEKRVMELLEPEPKAEADAASDTSADLRAGETPANDVADANDIPDTSHVNDVNDTPDHDHPV